MLLATVVCLVTYEMKLPQGDFNCLLNGISCGVMPGTVVEAVCVVMIVTVVSVWAGADVDEVIGYV